jgi:hypothetical protein
MRQRTAKGATAIARSSGFASLIISEVSAFSRLAHISVPSEARDRMPVERGGRNAHTLARPRAGAGETLQRS